MLSMVADFKIIKITAVFFDLLTNNLSRSKTLEINECFQWSSSNSNSGFRSILECYNPQRILIVTSRSFFKKKNRPFLLIKEQKNSNQNSIGFKWLPKQFQINISCLFTHKTMVVLTFRNVWFLNKQWLIEPCHYFFYSFGLLVAYGQHQKNAFSSSLFYLNWHLIFSAVLHVRLWFSGADTTRFRFFKFFFVGPLFHGLSRFATLWYFDSSHISISNFKIRLNCTFKFL